VNAENTLPRELIERIRAAALEQVRMMVELEAALRADDVPRALAVAWKIVGIEHEIEAL
jgi:hypothetical protein